MTTEGVRIDKWLWAVRLFKTRSLASEACRAGRITIDGVAAKPSRDLKPGDILVVGMGTLKRTIGVKALLTNRVSAKLVPEYLNDLTPPEEYERLQILKELSWERRPRGTGRPTKQERRSIDRLKDTL